ncbi:MAG TPA: helix-turn-helix domain-containing protein [Rugosimonospora sp.]|nr:helix-turn-helix domain-containing protein [Rugosimonospora sp.]
MNARRAGATPGGQRKPFKELFEALLASKPNPDTNNRYTVRELAARLKTYGVGVTYQYLHQLQTGARTNPTVAVVEGLVQVFEVPPMYFFDNSTAGRVDEQLAELKKLRDELTAATALQQALDDPLTGIIAVRARGLSPGTLRQLHSLVEQFRALEQLDSTKDDDG